VLAGIFIIYLRYKGSWDESRKKEAKWQKKTKTKDGSWFK
jgi:hypothetical protein